MSRLAWTTKITALCEVSSCVNSSVFVFLAPARIIFSIFWDEKQEISLVWPNFGPLVFQTLYRACIVFCLTVMQSALQTFEDTLGLNLCCIA